MIKAVLALALISLAPGLLLWLTIEGLRKGVVKGRGGPLARVDHPIAFWIVIAAHAGAISVWVYFMGTVASDAWRHGWN